MNQDLEALLKAFEAFQEASEEEEEAKLLLFEAQIEAVSRRIGAPQQQIARLVRVRYPAWIRAQRKTPTIPPKA